MAAVLLLTDAALAITAPTSTTAFAYDLYDIAVNNILKGPIGFVAGLAAVVLGCIVAMKNQIMAAIPCVLGGAALLKADSLVVSLGLIF